MSEVPATYRAGADRAAALSPRQREVLLLFAHGLTRRQVAERLGVGEEAVKRHATLARYRLRARNTTHAVALLLTGGAGT